jgi:predicted nucleic acid-binding protein
VLADAPPALDELSRAMDIDRRYSDLGLGLVDGSVIALAEGLGIRRLATRDVRLLFRRPPPPLGSVITGARR